MSPQADIYRYLAPQLKGKDVLEIGFGTGFGVLQYAHEARTVIGIEVDPDAVTWASQNIPLENVAWMNDDGTHFNFKQRFDAVVMFEVLEHIKDYRAALYNVAAHLRDGGKLYLSARNANADLRKNDLHEREWTAQQLISELGNYFSAIELFDYTLTHAQDWNTRQTPLVAVAIK